MPNMFKRPSYQLLAAFLAIFITAAGPVAARQMPYGQGVLWELLAPSGGVENYLFGTMHSTDARVTTLPKPVNRAFFRARSLTVEVVVTKDMPVRMARRMMLPARQNLEQIADAPLFARLAAIGEKIKIPVETLRRLKPWAAAAAISIPPDERAAQAAGRLPLDQVLQHAAVKRGIPVFGLESIEEQLDLMDGLPLVDQIKLLRQAVKDSARISELVATLKKFYLARDIEGMFAWMRRQAAGEDPRLMEIFQDRMIDARNRLMAKRMAARLSKGGAFVAIGAAHLPGRRGVLSLLDRQGYRITRVY